MTSIRAIAFDFDGVLGVPYTHPEQVFEQVRPLLGYLVQHDLKLCVVSFNPHAWTSLERAGLVPYFTAFRAGSNTSWAHHDYEQYSDAQRVNLSKATQMKDILDNEWKEYQIQSHECLLIDDDLSNIASADEAGFQTLFVYDSFLGISWTDIHAKISNIPFPSDEQIRVMSVDKHHAPLLKGAIAMRFLSKIQQYSPQHVNDALVAWGKLSANIGPTARNYSDRSIVVCGDTPSHE